MEVVTRLKQISFRETPEFYWESGSQTLSYDPKRIASEEGQLQLLHELAHALLDHHPGSDDEVYSREREAWNLARSLAEHLGVKVNGAYIARALQSVEQAGY